MERGWIRPRLEELNGVVVEIFRWLRGKSTIQELNMPGHASQNLKTMGASVASCAPRYSVISSLTLSSVIMLISLILFSQIDSVSAWTQEQLDMYDLVEEVNMNFYDLVGVPEDASSAQIRKAFRTKSLALHPDKNNAADAEEKFRQLVGVVDVLKNLELRDQYDDVLRNGLPNWKQPIYYFRATAKMSVQGVCILLVMVSGLMHYCALWARYVEKYWSWKETTAGRRKKKKDKKGNSEEVKGDVESMAAVGIIAPSMSQIFWITLAVYIWNTRSRQRAAEQEIREAANRDEEQRIQQVLQETQREQERVQMREKAQVRQQRLAKTGVLDDSIKAYRRKLPPDEEKVDKAPRVVKTGLWSENERSLLAKAINRYPGGTIDRWNVIANEMNRTVKDVIKEAHTAHTALSKQSSMKKKSQMSDAAKQIQERQEATTVVTSTDTFSQSQQDQLQQALRSVPKDAADRWDQIAALVDDKTKEDCQRRVRWLVAHVAKKKAQA